MRDSFFSIVVSIVYSFFCFLFFLYQFLRVNVFLVCFEFGVCISQREQNICFLDTQTKKSNDTQIVKTDVYSPSIFVSINWNTTCKMDTSWLLISFLLRENFELAQPKAKKNHMQIRFAPLIYRMYHVDNRCALFNQFCCWFIHAARNPMAIHIFAMNAVWESSKLDEDKKKDTEIYS